MLMVLNNGAHFCAPPVHTEGKRPLLFALIADRRRCVWVCVRLCVEGRFFRIDYSNRITRYLLTQTRPRKEMRAVTHPLLFLRGRLEAAGRSCLPSEEQGAHLTDTADTLSTVSAHTLT